MTKMSYFRDRINSKYDVENIFDSKHFFFHVFIDKIVMKYFQYFQNVVENQLRYMNHTIDRIRFVISRIMTMFFQFVAKMFSKCFIRFCIVNRNCQ